MVSRNSILRLVSKMDIIARPIPGPYNLTSQLIDTAPITKMTYNNLYFYIHYVIYKKGQHT